MTAAIAAAPSSKPTSPRRQRSPHVWQCGAFSKPAREEGTPTVTARTSSKSSTSEHASHPRTSHNDSLRGLWTTLSVTDCTEQSCKWSQICQTLLVRRSPRRTFAPGFLRLDGDLDQHVVVPTRGFLAIYRHLGGARDPRRRRDSERRRHPHRKRRCRSAQRLHDPTQRIRPTDLAPQRRRCTYAWIRQRRARPPDRRERRTCHHHTN